MEEQEKKSKGLSEKLNPGLGLVVKRLLLFTVLALFFAAGAVGLVYLSAQVIAPPEELTLEIEPRGAENNYQQLAEEQSRQRSLLEEELAAARENQHLIRRERLGETEDLLQELKDSRSWLIDRESERFRQERLRDNERQLAEFEQQRRAEASREINRLQEEIEDRIAAIDVGYDPEDEEILRQIREQALEEYREELLNIRIKLRTLILSSEREAELRNRLEAIENIAEERVEQIRAGLDAQIDQHVMRETARLRLEFVNAQEQIREEMRRDIAEKERELEELQIAWDQSEEERIAAELSELENRLERQYARLRENQLGYW